MSKTPDDPQNRIVVKIERAEPTPQQQRATARQSVQTLNQTRLIAAQRRRARTRTP